MNYRKFLKNFSVLFVATAFLASCGGGSSSGSDGEDVDLSKVNSKRTGVAEVIVYESADLDKIHPVNSSSANSTYVEGNIFMGLMSVSPKEPYDIVPILVVAQPTITPITEGKYAGGLSIAYEMRPEAKWDNGDAITSKDVLFSVKAVKNPNSDCHNVRPYYEFIEDVVLDEENERKFTFMCNDAYFQAEIWSAITVYPEYMYDANKIMRDYTIPQLNDKSKQDEFKSDVKLREFADEWNSEKFQRDPNYVSGCGPYRLEEWITGQRIVLKKKDNWWGDALTDLEGFEHNTPKITYEIITDQNTATTALKDEALDVMRGILPRDFVDMRSDEDIKLKYNFHSPSQFAYSYIGLNQKNPKLSDVRVRKALSHALDIEEIMSTLVYNLAERTVGPFHPSKEFYNNDIELYDYNLEKANALLDEAGWIDSDGDGTRDKTVDGKKTPLSIALKISQGSSNAAKIGEMYQESLAKVGVNLEIQTREWTVFLDENKNHNYEMYLAGWVGSPVLPDPKQIWHTESYDGGSNYGGFGNAESDALIDAIRYELDDDKRNEMYMEFQEIVHNDAPYIFMYSTLNRLAIHRRFDNAEPTTGRPGYAETEFRLNADYGATPE